MSSTPTRLAKHNRELWLPWLGVYVASVLVILAVLLGQVVLDHAAGRSSSKSLTADTVIIYTAASIIFGLLLALKYLPLILIAARRLRHIATDSITVASRRYKHILIATAVIDLLLVAWPQFAYQALGWWQGGPDSELGLVIEYLIVVFPGLLLTTVMAAFILTLRLRHS